MRKYNERTPVLCEGVDSQTEELTLGSDCYTGNGMRSEYSSLRPSSISSDIHCGLIDSGRSSITSEMVLFRAVIMQALLDSVTNSKRTEDMVAKRQALQWFNDQNEDFHMVCGLANLNSKWVLAKSNDAIANECKWRNVKDKTKVI